MKNFTTSFLLSLLIAFSFTACNSDSSDDNSDAQNSTRDYWPTAVNNNWTFTQDGEESNMKIIGIDEIDGSKYYKFDQMIGASSSIGAEATIWIKKNNGDYYLKMGEIDIDLDGLTGKMTGYQFLFFKDYLEVNQSWNGKYASSTSYNIPNYPAIVTNVDYTGKILEKGTTLKVNGITYNDVIKFSFKQVASQVSPVDGHESSSQTITNYWIAKGVGIIKMDNNGSITELKSCVIK